jgi:hypothetical protein
MTAKCVWVKMAMGALALAAGTGCSSSTPGPGPVTDPSKLPAPPAGQGFQFKTDAFPVPAGTEEQDCYFYRVRDLAKAGGLPESEPVNLHRVQLVQRDGSHHMNLFRVRTILGLDPAKGPVVRNSNGVGECFKSPNWADWPLIANTQQDGQIDWTFPDGVANVLQPDEWIMLQTHYVNASTQKSPDGVGEVAVNFWTIPKDQVKHEMGTLFATKQNIRVCQNNPTPTFTGQCNFKNTQPIHIIGANGHFHGRGTRFDMFSADGTVAGLPPESARFYSSTSWDDPPMLRSPDLNVTVPAGGAVAYSCSYQWKQPSLEAGGCDALNKYDGEKYGTRPENQNCCYTFGPIVEKNEHCNIFVYYYPKVDDVVCQ